MTYEYTNPERFIIAVDEPLEFVNLDEEQVTSLITKGAWDKEEYDLIESYSTSMNLIKDRRLYFTIVAESYDKKIALAVLSDDYSHIRAFVTYNPEEMKGVEFETKEAKILKGYNGWWATMSWVDPFRITLLTKRELWQDIWKDYPPLGYGASDC